MIKYPKGSFVVADMKHIGAVRPVTKRTRGPIVGVVVKATRSRVYVARRVDDMGGLNCDVTVYWRANR